MPINQYTHIYIYIYIHSPASWPLTYYNDIASRAWRRQLRANYQITLDNMLDYV